MRERLLSEGKNECPKWTFKRGNLDTNRGWVANDCRFFWDTVHSIRPSFICKSAKRLTPRTLVRWISGKVKNPRYEIAQIIQRFLPEVIAKYPLSGHQKSILNLMSLCKTAALGGHKEQCEQCHYSREAAPKTNKIKKVSYGDIFIFPNQLILRHHRISKNKNLIQNHSFCEDCLFWEWPHTYSL
jgi:hypothetical protein